MRKIIFTTFRENKGATGGPGGVLFLQSNILGGRINDLPCEFHFSKHFLNSKLLNRLINYSYFYLKFIFVREAYFICHDINMACLLAMLGKKYSLIFHHQGPIVQEMINLGENLSSTRIKSLQQRERKAFLNANTLHFPSRGAADMYFESQYANCKREEVNIVDPLYNIIPLVAPHKPEGLNLVQDDNYITLFSLGTLTAAKGQDQTVAFLKEYAKTAPKPLRYLMVGKGPLKDQLLQSLEDIKKEKPSFCYLYFEALSHEAVMYLHKISDVYIMLHRISIFDFATLEAMSQKSAVILSKVGGNLDFDMDNNIIFAEDALTGKIELANVDIETLKNRNYRVFCEHFSREAFIKQYQDFLMKYANNNNN